MHNPSVGNPPPIKGWEIAVIRMIPKIFYHLDKEHHCCVDRGINTMPENSVDYVDDGRHSKTDKNPPTS